MTGVGKLPPRMLWDLARYEPRARGEIKAGSAEEGGGNEMICDRFPHLARLIPYLSPPLR